MRERLLLQRVEVAQEGLNTLRRGEGEAILLKRNQTRFLVHLPAQADHPKWKRCCHRASAFRVSNREVEFAGRGFGLPPMLCEGFCIGKGGGAEEGSAVDEAFGVFAAGVIDVNFASAEEQAVDLSAEFAR